MPGEAAYRRQRASDLISNRRTGPALSSSRIFAEAQPSITSGGHDLHGQFPAKDARIAGLLETPRTCFRSALIGHLRNVRSSTVRIANSDAPQKNDLLARCPIQPSLSFQQPLYRLVSYPEFGEAPFDEHTNQLLSASIWPSGHDYPARDGGILLNDFERYGVYHGCPDEDFIPGTMPARFSQQIRETLDYSEKHKVKPKHALGAQHENLIGRPYRPLAMDTSVPHDAFTTNDV